ncbi:MAG: SDR family oxidoreductase [Chloroflexi bacterium]|nr:SDR family oxidoreductase [Chloroflexota bacterium]
MTARPSTERQHVLITGASSGIGAELARVFAEHGYDLVLVARREAELAALGRQLAASHGVDFHVIPADLADPVAPGQLVDTLRERGLTIDILVNNAGYGLHGAFAQTDLDTELRMIQLNVTALTHLTKLLLPGMLARRRGRVLNVASTASFMPGPFMAVYYATKAYVLSFSEAIANELQGTNVTVTALCPGPTHTGFAAAASANRMQLFTGPRVMDAATVARIGFAALMRGRRVVIPGFRNRWLIRAAGLLPRSLVLQITRRLQAPSPA